MRSVPALAAAVAVVGVAAPAHASLLWDFSFGDGTNSASGTLTTDAESSGFYTVTGATGQYDGTMIAGLAPIDIGRFGASDNRLYPAPTFLDLGGIGFDLSGGGQEVIYAAEGGGTFFEYDENTQSAGGGGTFTASLSVPEPASTGLIAAALASLALARRRRG